MGKPKKKCSTCMHYQPSPVRGQGWCRNPALRKPHERSLVGGKELACDKKFYDFWEAAPARGERPGTDTAAAPPSATPMKPSPVPAHPRAQTPSPAEPAFRSMPRIAVPSANGSRTYLYATGVLVLLLIGLGGLLLASGQEPQTLVQVQTTTTPTTAAAAATAPVPTATVPAPSPTATTAPPTPTVGKSFYQVANTDKLGVFIRRTPQMGDRIAAWPEGTTMEVIGPDTTTDGQTWKHVKDPKGNEGWVPAQYLVPKE